MHKYSNYITSLAIVLQVIFLTASVVRFEQFITLAIGLPKSDANQQGCRDGDITMISINAAGDLFMSFDKIREVKSVAIHDNRSYNHYTIRVKNHHELGILIKRIRKQYPYIRIMVAANKNLPAPVIMRLFSTLGGVHINKFSLLTRW